MVNLSDSDPDLERKKEIQKILEINRRIEALEEGDVEFLIRFSEALRKRVPTLVPYDCYVPLISHVPEKIYFINVLRNFVNPLEILKLRDACQGSRNKNLPDVAYFRTNVIDPCQFETDTIERPIMMRAEAVRAALAEVLQLRSGNKRGLACPSGKAA